MLNLFLNVAESDLVTQLLHPSPDSQRNFSSGVENWAKSVVIALCMVRCAWASPIKMIPKECFLPICQPLAHNVVAVVKFRRLASTIGSPVRGEAIANNPKVTHWRHSKPNQPSDPSVNGLEFWTIKGWYLGTCL